MRIYITKQAHGKYNYLANWNNPDTSATMGQWFISLKDLKEYTAAWGAKYIKVNF